MKEAVKAELKRAGAYKHMPVQNGMGEPALDFHVCCLGRYAGIETKAPGKMPTPRQVQTMRNIAQAGGSLFVIDDSKGADMAALIAWLAFGNTRTISPLAAVALGETDESRDDRLGDPEHAE